LVPRDEYCAVSIPCVGARYPNRSGGDREFEIKVSVRGDALKLEHEPRNPADGNAIKVLSSRGIQMGYISADRTWLIHRAWRSERSVHAIFQGAYPGGCWIRVGFDQIPSLPPAPQDAYLPDRPSSMARESVDHDPGYWPD
jgi:hypothetical protein